MNLLLVVSSPTEGIIHEFNLDKPLHRLRWEKTKNKEEFLIDWLPKNHNIYYISEIESGARIGPLFATIQRAQDYINVYYPDVALRIDTG